MKLLFKFALSLFILACSAPVFAKGTSDSDWVTFEPTKESGCERKDAGRSVEIKGDFNGDKKPDTARIEINRKLKRSRLAVWLSGEKTSPIVIREWDGTDEDDFVALVEPSKQKTWCGKTGECNPGDSKAVTLKAQSIGFGTCESSEAIYHWDAKAKKFQEDWISD